MKILMICGSYPPELCGVGDYTHQLVNHLSKEGINVTLMVNRDWKIASIFKIISEIKNTNPDIIHLQYPSTGYGFSLIPQLISLLFKTTVTLHEVSHSHLIRQISLLPFSFRSNIIFTNKYEDNYFRRIFPWYRRKSVIIPIGSNIDVTKRIPVEKRNITEIVYFGQIRPKKGIEEVINLSKIFADNHSRYKIIIAGQLLKQFENYYNQLKQIEGFNLIEWKLNLSDNEIGNLLAEHLLYYLPFPDGASERRGSLFASLSNLGLVFTTKGKQTSDELTSSVEIVNSEIELFNLIHNLTGSELINKQLKLESNILNYIQKLKWSNIASTHINYYKSNILNN